MSSKRSRTARAIMAETGMKYTAALREADRRHALAQAASPSRAEEHAMAGFGEFLQNLLAPTAESGPPYVHTFVPPEPIGEDEDGNDIYPPPGPAYTLTERLLASTSAAQRGVYIRTR